MTNTSKALTREQELSLLSLWINSELDALIEAEPGFFLVNEQELRYFVCDLNSLHKVEGFFFSREPDLFHTQYPQILRDICAEQLPAEAAEPQEVWAITAPAWARMRAIVRCLRLDRPPTPELMLSPGQVLREDVRAQDEKQMLAAVTVMLDELKDANGEFLNHELCAAEARSFLHYYKKVRLVGRAVVHAGASPAGSLQDAVTLLLEGFKEATWPFWDSPEECYLGFSPAEGEESIYGIWLHVDRDFNGDNRHSLETPPCEEVGSWSQPGILNFEDALWHFNSCREHDGLAPLSSVEELPEGSRLIPEDGSLYHYVLEECAWVRKDAGV